MTKLSAIESAVLLLFVMVTGCQRESPPAAEIEHSDASAATATASANNESEEEHGHKPGAHGGLMVSLGADSYHAEAVFEQNGKLRLYTLGNDESRVIDVESQTLKAFARLDASAEAIPFVLEPEPQEGDADGRTSQFVGQLPMELAGKSIDVTIPSLVISGERFRVRFTSVTESADHADEMPDRVADDKERELYLTPGGLYTDADIAANGGETASMKFKGIPSSHDMFPEAGERICPVTKTRANPKFTWIVGGKPYQFCCPPCVDEFVRAAKQATEPLPEPESFVK